MNESVNNEQQVIAYVNWRLKAIQHAISCCETLAGKPRQTMTITTFTEGDYTKSALKDREMEQTLFRSGGSIIETLFGLADAYTGGARDWKKTGRGRYPSSR